MKVRFTKDYFDGYTTFKCGWVAGFTQTKCNYLIAQCVAVPVGEGTRALKYAPTKTPIVKCFDDEPAAVQTKTAIAPKQQTNTTKKD